MFEYVSNVAITGFILTFVAGFLIRGTATDIMLWADHDVPCSWCPWLVMGFLGSGAITIVSSLIWAWQ